MGLFSEFHAVNSVNCILETSLRKRHFLTTHYWRLFRCGMKPVLSVTSSFVFFFCFCRRLVLFRIFTLHSIVFCYFFYTYLCFIFRILDFLHLPLILRLSFSLLPCFLLISLYMSSYIIFLMWVLLYTFPFSFHPPFSVFIMNSFFLPLITPKERFVM
jgi:hypothetical protein